MGLGYSWAATFGQWSARFHYKASGTYASSFCILSFAIEDSWMSWQYDGDCSCSCSQMGLDCWNLVEHLYTAHAGLMSVKEISYHL